MSTLLFLLGVLLAVLIVWLAKVIFDGCGPMGAYFLILLVGTLGLVGYGFYQGRKRDAECLSDCKSYLRSVGRHEAECDFFLEDGRRWSRHQLHKYCYLQRRIR